LNRRKTVPQLRSELEEVRGRRINARTISRRLKEALLEGTKKAPLLQRRHRVAKLDFAKDENWKNDQSFLFTDESQFCVNIIEGRERLYRRRGE